MAIVSNKRVKGTPNVHFYQEAAAGSANDFQVGDLVKFDTSGELVIATASNILGIALKAATGTASTEIPVDVLMGDEFSAVWTSEATTETLLNDIADFTFTTGAQVLTGAGTTDCVVVDFDDPVGTSGGRVIVKIIPASQQLGSATE